jgi:hypothetical protein
MHDVYVPSQIITIAITREDMLKAKEAGIRISGMAEGYGEVMSILPANEYYDREQIHETIFDGMRYVLRNYHIPAVPCCQNNLDNTSAETK